MSSNAKGIDVYAGDGQIDWQKVLDSGISFAFIKASQGASWVDKSFNFNWTRCGQVGITRAPYHFFTGDAGGVQQAHHAMSVVTLPPRSLPWILDLEQAGHLSPSDLAENALHWLQEVEMVTQRAPIIYGPRDFLATNLGGNAAFARYPLYLAHPGSSVGTLPAPWTEWAFWQSAFGETAQGWTVPGCPGKVDGDFYNGTHSDLVTRFDLR